ncbi:alpha/beta fold hydrolase [Lentibacillus sediminis]|uniref:alpha/beta fold hydrolase n=1 Tax=Lentibacillus sediminis TaxID=1940529 RepID=UPI000C1BEB7D|nr:alpha/beta fold hydrolase [Lentibacillus sediminis]
MKRKYILVITSFSVVLLGFAVVFNVPSQTRSEIYQGAPTVFVHGYKGTENSFGSMLERFEEDYHWGNKGLVYYISEEGKIRDYNLSKGREVPTFVQVIFEDNRASFAETADWLAKAVSHMKKHYFMDAINLVGHSMGGIVALKYVQDYQGRAYPEVNKLIAIGSPFAGIFSPEYFHIHHDPAAKDLKPNSVALQIIHENSVPKQLEVFNIGSTGDTVAVPESVLALESIVPEDQLEQEIIQDRALGHSMLHESRKVDQLIYSFLWQDRNQ